MTGPTPTPLMRAFGATPSTRCNRLVPSDARRSEPSAAPCADPR
jgi:hypothetical protein